MPVDLGRRDTAGVNVEEASSQSKRLPGHARAPRSQIMAQVPVLRSTAPAVAAVPYTGVA